MTEDLKTIQFIDGRLTGSFGFWRANPEEFSEIFPGDGQDIEIAAHLADRIGERADELLGAVLQRPILKQQLRGIDGTLLFEAEDRREFLPPTMRERDWASRHLNEAQQKLAAGTYVEPDPPEGGWRNIQVISSARNCTFSVFRAMPQEFTALFPMPGQDIELAEDVFDRLGIAQSVPLLTPIWTRPIAKADVLGIHGTLFFDFQHRRVHIPASKRERDREGGV
ncbi:MAG TPA: hypothetical protein VM689_12520 [Aliidongia sp.]|nr:hypothetical protein [Aliidongia sp.]